MELDLCESELQRPRVLGKSVVDTDKGYMRTGSSRVVPRVGQTCGSDGRYWHCGLGDCRPRVWGTGWRAWVFCCLWGLPVTA